MRVGLRLRGGEWPLGGLHERRGGAGSTAEGGVESSIPAGERSDGHGGEEVSGVRSRGPGLGDLGGKSEVREDLANDPRVLDGGEQAHEVGFLAFPAWLL